MPHFRAADGTILSYRTLGAGPPVLALPGGPMRDAGYLGDLGGLAEHHTLHLLDPRGTGASAAPTDPATYRVDQQVSDVEAWRIELGRERVVLLGHSAGAALALHYAAVHRHRVERLVLAFPSPRAIDLTITPQDRRSTAALRAREPWYPPAAAALERMLTGRAGPDDAAALDPFGYGRWDDTAREHAAGQRRNVNDEAAARYYAAGGPGPDGLRAALAALRAPVLLVAGQYDLQLPAPRAQAYAAVLGARLVVLPGAAHSGWLDTPDRFVAAVTAFLAD